MPHVRKRRSDYTNFKTYNLTRVLVAVAIVRVFSSKHASIASRASIYTYTDFESRADLLYLRT
jgi:hypothetical protein